MTWNIHYRADFELEYAEPAQQAWEILVKTVRNWVKYRPEKQGLLTKDYYGNWFFLGGTWKPSSKEPFFIKSVSSSEKAYGNPKFWALQYFHPCDHPARKWKIDIAITAIGQNRFLFSMTVFHDILQGYIGYIPSSPTPTVPLLIKNIIKSDFWHASSGTENLLVNALTIETGQGMDFKNRLADLKRQCPIVLVSCDQENNHLIDPNNLSWNLVGAASVYTYTDSIISEELYHCIGASYRCQNGAVRIYNPGLLFDSPGDSRKHRFINRNSILRFGQKSVVEMLVDGLSRRARNNQHDYIRSVNDIVRSERESIINSLKVKTTEQEKFYITYINDIEKELSAERTANDNLQNQLIDKENSALETKAKNHAVIIRLTNEIKAYKRQCNSCKKMETFRELPITIEDAVLKIRNIFPDNVIVLDECVTSAGECDFFDINYAWQCLFSLCSSFPDFLFKDKLSFGSAAEKFNNEYPYRIALTESSSTKKDKKLIATRKVEYMGDIIDVSPHITLNRNNRYLRIHFGIPKKTEAILLFHCGKHQDTAGTRRRKN